MTVKIRSIIPAMTSNRNAYINSMEYEKSIEKMASGLEIVRAADGPSSLIISEQMRAQITGLNQALDNSEVATSLVKTTEAALAEVNRMLITLRQLAVHASNEAINDPYMLEADQQEVDNVVDAINRIAKQTAFGNKPILNGSNSSLGITVGKNLEFIFASEKTADSPEGGYEVLVEQAATRANVTTEILNSQDFDEGLELNVQTAGNVMKMKFPPGANLDVAVNQINKNFSQFNVDVEAIYVPIEKVKKAGNETEELVVAPPDTGKILFRSKEFGSDAKFNIGFNRPEVIKNLKAYDVASIHNGKDVKGTVGGETLRGQGQILRGTTGAKTHGLEIRYKGEEEIQEPIEAGSVIIRQNAMRFQIGGNYGETKSIGVNSIYAKHLAQNVENRSGFDSLQDIKVLTFDQAQDTLRLLEKAGNEIASLRGDLGAFQKNNLESNIDSLSIGAESIINSESVIRDADTAEKYVNLTKNQLMKDTALSMVAHSNRAVQKSMQLINPS